MLLPDISKITIDKIHMQELGNNYPALEMLRLDKIHPVISGNKWFKLKWHIENFRNNDYKGVITFGGAWSNHIIATACACYQQNIKSVGIIRGEEPVQYSLTLQEALKYKMELKFISRQEYSQKSTAGFLQKIKAEFPGYYIIDEGGRGAEGERGAAEILDLVNKNDYTHIVCAIGTATMFKGLMSALVPGQIAVGIPVIKGFTELADTACSNIYSEYHFGGYAKHNLELISFINNYYIQTGIPTDFVYTGKLAFAVNDLIKKEIFKKEDKLLLIHSGGLQGNLSLTKGTLIF